MLPEELLRKVRYIEITTRKMVDDVMSGQYRSHFKGHGVQFSEHRQYVPGDDIRHIDWKVSARTRDLLIKKFEEERELTVLLVVDVSASGQFGSNSKLKSEMAAEIAGMLAYAAIHTGDKVGVLLFSGGIDHIIRPKKGRQHILRIIRDILSHRPQSKGTDLKGALKSANRILKHSGVVFVLTDFLAKDYEIELKQLARRHEVVAIKITDDHEQGPPAQGMFLFINPETGQEQWINTGSYSFRKWLQEFQTEFDTDTKSALKTSQVEWFEAKTHEDYGEAVVQFFRARRKKRGR